MKTHVLIIQHGTGTFIAVLALVPGAGAVWKACNLDTRLRHPILLLNIWLHSQVQHACHKTRTGSDVSLGDARNAHISQPF